MRFLVQYSCRCCVAPDRQDWLTRTEILATTGYSEMRLKGIEESAHKERRELETR